MIYVVSEVENYNNTTSYVLFETTTESFFSGSKAFLQRINSKIHIENIEITEDNITIKQWYNKIHHRRLSEDSGSNYILLCQVDNSKFKLVTHDERVIIMGTEKLTNYTEQNQIANCKIINNQLTSIGTYRITKDIEFEKHIAEKYARYVALTSLLGKPMTFEYVIENKDVKLKIYTGTNKDVIIPKFITSIMRHAFTGFKLQTLTLDNGLKYIGYEAFEGCNISEVTIPETVEFISAGAFYGNKKLIATVSEISSKGNKYTNNLKLLNKDTIIVRYTHNN